LIIPVEFMNAAQIIVSVALIVAILVQVRGEGLGSIFGGEGGSLFRTRRGWEKTLFNFTIALAAVWLVVSLANAVGIGQ
jgi:preprotein translocase subunit SecG